MDRLQAYSVLGISQNAGEDEVKSAYRALAREYSPENCPPEDREAATEKMDEINEAFDILMSYIRTGTEPASPRASSAGSSPGDYASIRGLINAGRVDEALAQLDSIASGASDAEWNFLMGSVFYHKGRLDQALQFFQKAVQLSPGNREYEAALKNLQGSAGGNMAGNPYSMPQDNSATAMNCVCNTCALMCCVDACCGFCR